MDVWALGVTLFILLSGTFPFMETSTDQKVLFRKICKGNFEFDAHWVRPVHLMCCLKRSSVVRA